MRFILLFSVLIFSYASTAQVINPPSVPSVTVGGRTITDVNNVIWLTANSDGSAATKYTTLRRTTGTAGYQVTAAKTLYIVAHRCISLAANTTQLHIGYGDNDVGAISAAAPTNAVWQGGASNFDIFAYTATGIGQVVEGPMYFTVPATKYPAIKISTAGASFCLFMAYER